MTLNEEPINDKRRLAEAVRAACIRAALERYEQAAADGLCAEGAWECALDAMRALDLARVTTDDRRPTTDDR